jgi:hypothetical protein
VVRALLRKGGETIIVELQAEARFEQAALVDIPPEQQRREFPADLLLVSNVEYARRTQFSQAYLWGVEWWYWMEAHGYPEYLEAARRVFRRGDEEVGWLPPEGSDSFWQFRVTPWQPGLPRLAPT